MSETLLHASCVAIGDRGVLLAGASGSGKSDLALRLMDRGATLVSDDYTALAPRDGRLIATPPPRIAGSIEMRGVGILTVPHRAEVEVRLILDLETLPERLPVFDRRVIAGIALPFAALSALEPSAPLKVEQLLERFG
ncbi:HPr kinase/phosphorylase [Sphingomonas morindae]|uniref:HPr kinase/phosphatase C-terminal domain-containing protein n=1 Tax=Sphingomonas morindae TaxID=1541170 RepID=A0ABY4X8A7_9SPHN|nr:HPr kinase/phosphatase C-terminal domain-containing protein [Sphingomonas morindae]USI73167.1 HPr kinase/phosphatase C-terminal domain-containing protein [Sphingomonas morindae]